LDDLRLYTGSSHADKYFILNNDIDLTTFLSSGQPGYNAGAFWEPIGYTAWGAPTDIFYGHLDGGGYTISNLKMIREDNYTYVGLFSTIGSVAGDIDISVKNLTIITDSTGVKCKNHGGILAGQLLGEDSDIKVEDCIVIGAVSCSSTYGLSPIRVGGIAGTALVEYNKNVFLKNVEAYATFTRPYGAAYNSSYQKVWGGLLGHADNPDIDNCRAVVVAVGTPPEWSSNPCFETVGGLIGSITQDGYSNYSFIVDSSAVVNINACVYGGGLIGPCGGSTPGRLVVQRCFAEGSMECIPVSSYEGLPIAGLVSSGAVIYDSYARVDITVTGSYTASEAAGIKTDLVLSSMGSIHVYSACSISSESGNIYGLSASGGYGNGGYWDSEIGPSTDALSGSTGLTTAQAKTGSSYVDWNIGTGSVWGIDPAINDGYPYLLDNIPTPAYVTVAYNSGINGHVDGTVSQTILIGSNTAAVEAIPDLGYAFKQWSDGRVDNPRQDIGVLSDKSITAEFVIGCMLTYTSTINGTIVGESEQLVPIGDAGDPVTADPVVPYIFDEWSDGRSDNPRQDLAVSADVTVEASYVEGCVLEYVADTGGTIEGESFQVVHIGAEGTLVVARADLMYAFDKWSDGVTDQSRTDIGVAGTTSVTAQFLPPFAGGTGTSSDPFRIEYPHQLNNLRYYSGGANADKYYVLNNDIDLEPITDYYSGWTPIPNFFGHLNGNGFKVIIYEEIEITHQQQMTT
jgi:hypothetical protein